MDDQEHIPDYLTELLQPTPSGTEKLLAAWDALSLETRLRIWTLLRQHSHPTYLRERITDKALVDGNAYVRYLAARELDRESDESDRSEVTHSVTAEDPSELVRYAHLEDEYGDIGGGLLTDPASFFALPHAARLARVRCLKENAEEIAAILTHGVLKGLPREDMSEVELFEVAHEFTQSAYVRHRKSDARGLRDGYAEYLDEKGLEALWHCVPVVPEVVALPLVKTLPERQGSRTGIPQKVLDEFPRRLLVQLLEREDISLQKFRKKLALDATNDHASNDMAAVNLRLSDDELSKILVDPKDVTEESLQEEPTQDNISGRLRLLTRFAVLGWGLEPVHLLVISDVLQALPVFGLHNPGEEGGIARVGYEKAMKRAAERNYTDTIDRVRMYQAAQCASDWRSSKVHKLPESIQSLNVQVEPGNPWITLKRLESESNPLFYSRAMHKLRKDIWLDEIGEKPSDLFDDD